MHINANHSPLLCEPMVASQEERVIEDLGGAGLDPTIYILGGGFIEVRRSFQNLTATQNLRGEKEKRQSSKLQPSDSE